MTRPTYIDREVQELLSRPGVHDRILAAQTKSKVTAPSYQPTQGNPFIVGPTFNLTSQMRLKRDNPALFERLKAEAAGGDA